MLNRDGLDVLVHPLTESSYDDHSKNALWLGTPVPMRLDILRPQYSESLLPRPSGRLDRERWCHPRPKCRRSIYQIDNALALVALSPA